MTTTLEITAPDDFHVHLRDDAMLKAVLPHTVKQFARALVMPNLRPPVRDVQDALAYRKRIMDLLPADTSFVPLMSLYLTDTTTPEVIREAAQSGIVKACKLYPAGATTNSSLGVTNIENIFPVLNAMAEHNLVLCIHGEDTSEGVDFYDREKVFVNKTLPTILNAAPKLKVILEHCTTKLAADFVANYPDDRLAATITCHHILYNRNSLFAGGRLYPHMFCLPILKTEEDRLGLLNAIKNDSKGRFFLGTDTAPHMLADKSSPHLGCSAGIFTAVSALELYTEAFESFGILDKLEAFCSINGAQFYGLPRNQHKVKLSKTPRVIPAKVPVEGGTDSEVHCIVPLQAGKMIQWSLLE